MIQNMLMGFVLVSSVDSDVIPRNAEVLTRAHITWGAALQSLTNESNAMAGPAFVVLIMNTRCTSATSIRGLQ